VQEGGLMTRSAPFAKRLVLALLLVALPATAQAKEPPRVLSIKLEDQIIQPVTARFVARSLQQAEAMKAQCLIIQLDTPGGLLDSTHRIVKDILHSEIPVVVYVAPQGAHAASAGVFITLAAHVAVMAPGTNIGAAHPVSGGAQQASDVMMNKAVNDAVAWARSLAQQRHRNADWVARAVQDSISTPAEQALQEKIIDFLAVDEVDLLDKLNGRSVVLDGKTVVLDTAGAEVEHLEMSWSDRLLCILANPSLAYILLLLGIGGLGFELTHPGSWIPGILGLVCLTLAFFALQVLPISYAGLALLGLGLLLLVLEVKFHSLGLLAVAGLICMLLGSFMLVEPQPGIERVSWVVILPATTGLALIVLFLVGNVLRAHQAPVRTGKEELLGSVGVARSEIDLDRPGWVDVQGELWQARSSTRLRAGERVRILQCLGLSLFVERVDEEREESIRKA
jgi:membrane-bound serine protease (ClpP class)